MFALPVYNLCPDQTATGRLPSMPLLSGLHKQAQILVAKASLKLKAL